MPVTSFSLSHLSSPKYYYLLNEKNVFMDSICANTLNDFISTSSLSITYNLFCMKRNKPQITSLAGLKRKKQNETAYYNLSATPEPDNICHSFLLLYHIINPYR